MESHSLESVVSTPISEQYEKLAAFYLGKSYDLGSSSVGEDLVMYDSKDLCTHAVLVGMTGSGKTGLGITLIEEAALDGIPALVVDPKGDMANLLLNFPELQPQDFRPWINVDDAERQGKTADEFAEDQATTWRKGLAAWGQGTERIRKLGESAEFTVYTPGSDAGIPISILSSFAAPPKSMLADRDMMRDRVSSTATSILSLLGIDADPVRSREHILLTNILDQAWRDGQSLDLGAIIRLVQTPPFTQVGVMDLDSFYPSKDRFELAMSINNLLASPGFSAWMRGEPLNIHSLLYGEGGKPRISIFSIAHLSDSERMFFVTLLLNQTISWMRSRSGTSSLRALLYIDEIFGYMPPVSEPPTKKPLLTLLKQARAFGIGLVLATQNPVDLDYKGLSNTGTWFIGRLQTERDKQRVLDGLEGASNEAGDAFDRNSISEILSNVGKRVFLMHNVHEDGPAIFHTRWALSYLSGPMTRDAIKKLMEGRSASSTASPPQPSTAKLASASSRPVLPPDITQVFLPIQRLTRDSTVVYRPCLLAVTKVHFVDTRKGLAADEERTLLIPFEDQRHSIDWDEAEELALFADDLVREPQDASAGFAGLASDATRSSNYSQWKKALEDHLYRTRRYLLFKSPTLQEISLPGESETDFRIRLSDKAHELRDDALQKLRKKYANRIRRLEERIEKAEIKVEKERQEAEGAKLQTAISFGATILSAVLGRKTFSAGNIGRATSAARGYGRQQKQASDVSRAQAEVLRYERELRDMEEEIQSEEDLIVEKYDPQLEELEELPLKPRKTDIDIRTFALGWAPFVSHDDGTADPLYC